MYPRYLKVEVGGGQGKADNSVNSGQGDNPVHSLSSTREGGELLYTQWQERSGHQCNRSLWYVQFDFRLSVLL